MKRVLYLLLSFPMFAFAEGGLPTTPYIYVEGRASIEKPADMVTLEFSVVGRASEQNKANAAAQEKSSKVLDLLKATKIDENDVIAETVRSQAEFEETEHRSNRSAKIIGYSVTRPFQVKVKSVTAFPKLVDELMKMEGVEVSGIEGGFSKWKEVQDQVWEKALADARGQAEKSLKPMGMKIDSVFAISPIAWPEIERNMFANRERVIVTGSSAPEPEPRYLVAPITISQSVHVIYLISPAK